MLYNNTLWSAAVIHFRIRPSLDIGSTLRLSSISPRTDLCSASKIFDVVQQRATDTKSFVFDASTIGEEYSDFVEFALCLATDVFMATGRRISGRMRVLQAVYRHVCVCSSIEGTQFYPRLQVPEWVLEVH